MVVFNTVLRDIYAWVHTMMHQPRTITNMTGELFTKYLERNCDTSESMEVEEWLATADAKSQDEILLKIWDASTKEMPEAQKNALWERLRRTLTPERKANQGLLRRIFFSKAMLAAASVLVCVIIIGTSISVNQRSVAGKTTVQNNKLEKVNVAVWDTIKNTGNKERIVTLEDGSGIILSAKSSVVYQKPFQENRRDIYQEGNVAYKVAKDKNRPFTVFCEDIATTALGTYFRVNGKSKEVKVWLYEGKVVVRSAGKLSAAMKDIFLLPGDKMIYDFDKNKATVQHQSINYQNELAGNKTPAANEGLKFNKTQLYKVFEKIEEKYSIYIEYNKEDISNMDFTGSINNNDSISIVLRAIANMNGLSITTTLNGFTVNKLPQ